MNRLDLAGAFYCDATVGGAFCALRWDLHIQTSTGTIPLPGENVLFLRLSRSGQIAGQAHVTGKALLWNGSVWNNAGTTHGVSPCVFDAAGNLVVATLAQGSQGYRYCASDGRLVTGDETYADPARQIWEYTTYGDVTIGQGNTGCLTISPYGRRMLALGDCRFVRFSREGNRCAVAMVRPGVATFFWFDVSELASLPLEVIGDPGGGGGGGGGGNPVPEVPAAEQQRAQAMLASVRTETGFGPNQPPLPYVRRVAQRLGGKWGLNGKRGNVNDPSGDILAYDFAGAQPQLYDVLGDGGGANSPQFGALEYPQTAGAVWLHPGVEEPGGGGGDPQPPDLEPRVKALEDSVRELLAQTDALRARDVDFHTMDNNILRRVTDLEARPPGQVPADVLRLSDFKDDTRKYDINVPLKFSSPLKGTIDPKK